MIRKLAPALMALTCSVLSVFHWKLMGAIIGKPPNPDALWLSAFMSTLLGFLGGGVIAGWFRGL